MSYNGLPPDFANWTTKKQQILFRLTAFRAAGGRYIFFCMAGYYLVKRNLNTAVSRVWVMYSSVSLFICPSMQAEKLIIRP